MSKWVASATLALTVAFTLASTSSLRAQQPSSLPGGPGLGVPFTTTGTGQNGTVAVSGVFRITQFLEQGGRAFAAGTLAIGVGDPTAPHTFVRQVVVPVLSIRSASTFASLTLALGTPTPMPGSATGFNLGNSVGTSGTPLFGATGTTGSNAPSGTAGSTSSGTAPSSSAGVAAATVPGAQANCGPFQVDLGPIDESGSTLSFHLDRLVLEVAAPAGAASAVSSLMCSADAALSAAANASAPSTTASGTSATTTVGGAGTTTSGTSGTTTSGTAGTTTGTTGTSGSAMTPTGTAGAQVTGNTTAAAGTPLQNLVATLNLVVGAL